MKGQKMKRTNESGRSMVEMLGVLAIIGVLSIGGIAGYSMAMNRYRANEALDAATKYAVILYAADQTKKATTGTALADSDVPDLATALGLTAGTKPGGADITLAEPKIEEDGVTLQLAFGTGGENVCKAAASIVGTASECDGTNFKHKFKQS